jgi:hypothetical protein
MSQKPQPAKRKRGILLSKKGWQRLQAAEMRYVNQHNDGKLLTLQDLSDRTGLSANTLARVRGRKIAVDQQTLECYFRAFELTLGVDDYTDSDGTMGGRVVLPPNGQMAIDSAFYISRTPVESMLQDAILNQVGGLVRFKGARQSGKSSLVSKVLTEVRSQSIATVMLNLRLVDSDVLQDLSKFLRWFCAVVTRSLGLENKLADYWDDIFGVSYNCTYYFETYLLPQLKKPFVLVLDDVDVVLHHGQVAADFYGMLRTWHEKARYGDHHSELWQQLRLVLVYSTDVQAPTMSLTQSPFNAGILIDLPGFESEQVEDLLQRYNVPDLEEVSAVLIQLVGSNPFLLHWAIYHLSLPDMNLEVLLESSTAPDGIYASHLRQKLTDILQDALLVPVLRQIVSKPIGCGVDSLAAFKLQSQGLVTLENQKWIPTCDLYRQFFAQTLPIEGV